MGIGMYDRISHKEIVNTFFKKTSLGPSEKTPGPSRKKNRLPLLITAFLLLAFFSCLAIIILYRGGYLKSGLAGYDAAQRVESLISGGVANRALIEEVRFEGDAAYESSFLKSSIRLVNQGPEGRAAFTISLKERLNLKNKSILVTARSEGALAGFKLLLQDKKGNFFMAKEVYLASRWSREHIFIQVKKNSNFNFDGVSALKIEFGSKTVGNRPGAIIHIKDLVIREGDISQ